ncbi:MAG: C_GCAxxG_C_C family protein [Thermoguttaceae bacterium]|nr:C_GCAxxG_C_C family protein [Thermoguttaceae bacterium]
MNKLNRRDALRIAGVGIGAALTGAASKVALAAESPVANPALVESGEAWKYAIIDPDKVARDAYRDYHIGHCMHTTFMSIVRNVGEELAKTDPLAGNAVLSFPFHMFHYGSSGGNGWGSLCGSLNGALAAINLFCGSEKTLKALCDELGNYYEKTMFPIFVPDDAEPMPQTISGSILCHVSSGKWCSIAKVRTDSPERTDRCSRLSADIAKKAAELLNLNVAQLNAEEPVPIVALKRPEPAATCVKCHSKGGENSDVIGKMTCNECHPEKTVDHHLTKR